MALKESEKRMARLKRWQADPENMELHRKRARERRRGTYLERKERRLANRGTPPPPADNRCELCERVPPYPVVPDHDHRSNVHRAWVCGGCNTWLGLIDKAHRERIPLPGKATIPAALLEKMLALVERCSAWW